MIKLPRIGPRFVVVGVFAASVACSGNGGLAGSNKPPQADAPQLGSAERNAGVRSGDASASANDAADQPVQVIGTYLTCVVNERSATAAAIACNAVRRGDRRHVDLKGATKSFQWSYKLDPGTAGTVTLAPPPAGSSWDIVYVLSAGSSAALETLLAGVHAVLDAVPLPSQMVTSATRLDGALADLLVSADDRGAVVNGPKTTTSDTVFVPPTTPLPPATVTPPSPLPAPAPAPAAPSALFPTLAGSHYPTSCNLVPGNSEYTVKDTFFGSQGGARTIGRAIYYYRDAGCTGAPSHVVKSVPELTFYYFAGETPLDGALSVAYDPASTRVTFYIRMAGDAADSKVYFATGL